MPATPAGPAARTAHTPLHAWHQAHGAQFRGEGGWQVVASYGDTARETAAAREGVALADLSAFAKVSLRGRGVAEAARTLAGDGPAARPRGVSNLDAGESILACRLTPDHLLCLAATPPSAGLDTLLSGLPAVRTDVTSALAGIAVVGPRAEAVLRRLTPLDLADAAMPLQTCAETSLAGVHALLVRSAELTVASLRVYVGWDVGEYVWEALFDAGRGGVTAFGLDGWRSLRQPSG